MKITSGTKKGKDNWWRALEITIPAGFTREFVEEIEARLTKDADLDMYEIENHFGSLNPQKQE